MKTIISYTTIGQIDLMLKGWQSGKQWGITNETEKELWIENAKGIRTAAEGQELVQVYNECTGIVYLVACLRNWKGALTVSEVVSNPQVTLEKESANQVGQIFINWVSQQNPNTDKQGLGCLFAWAAERSIKPLALTANTLGLIKLYSNYGFEVDQPKPGVINYLASPSLDKKYSKIDQNMKLNPDKKIDLLRTYCHNRDWIGP